MGLFDKIFKAPRVDMAPMVNIFQNRQNDINAFERKLDLYTSEYLNSLSALQQNTWNNFVPNTAAMYGARGIFTDSGAFADTIGREATNLQAQMAPATAEMKRQNALWTDQARGGNVASLMGAQHQATLTDLASQGGLNSAFGSMAGMAIGSMIPGGAGVGASLGSRIFGGGGSAQTGPASFSGAYRGGSMDFSGGGRNPFQMAPNAPQSDWRNRLQLMTG